MPRLRQSSNAVPELLQASTPNIKAENPDFPRYDPEVSRLRFQSALEAMNRTDGFQRTLLQIFDASALSERNSPYFFGRFRNGDHEIGNLVATKLARKFRDGPLRILELAMGRTYGDFPHCGAPWLSRALKEAFGSQVEITVSDYSFKDAQLFFLTPAKELHSLALPGGLKKAGPILGRYSGSPLPQPGFSRWDQISTNAELEDLIRPEINLALGKPADSEIPSETPLFLRPAIDSEFEERVFGIKARCQVDYTELERSFPNERFDVVFLRHLPPSMYLRQQSILKAAERIVVPDGVAIVFGDW